MDSIVSENFAFSSSISADVWHPQKDDKSYEWWYFDALSDDGREAVIIIFLDNFIYSPRYNRETISISGNKRFPAVSFTYYRDGQILYRSVTEFHFSDFHASEEVSECRIGESSFRFERAPYGSGYFVSVNAEISGGRKIEANLEWLSIEADLAPDEFCYQERRHCWNMVAPRADVTGRITVKNDQGEDLEEYHFRGTGYHDHNLDNRWLAKTVRDWHWGRVHFADSTAVFYRFRESDEEDATTRLILIRNGELQKRDVWFEEHDYVRDRFGIRYPSLLRLSSNDEIELTIRLHDAVDSSFYFLRSLSEFTITAGGSESRTTMGLTEYISPRSLRHQWLNWLSDVRTGKDGRSSYF